jgi:hypothetical protein
MMETLECASISERGFRLCLCKKLAGAVRCALGCKNGTLTVKVVDTILTPPSLQHPETVSNSEQGNRLR